eukprot:scaffold3962_cov122-Isochrysis_galbana.AAC.2
MRRALARRALALASAASRRGPAKSGPPRPSRIGPRLALAELGLGARAAVRSKSGRTPGKT